MLPTTLVFRYCHSVVGGSNQSRLVYANKFNNPQLLNAKRWIRHCAAAVNNAGRDGDCTKTSYICTQHLSASVSALAVVSDKSWNDVTSRER